MLLKVVLLGYSRGLISSRDIERACHENVTFIALSCDQRPDHSTIAAFVSSMKDQILSVFRDILLVCEEENLLGDTLFALDGCKLPSNASSRWSVTINDLKKKKEKIERKVKDLLREQIKIDEGVRRQIAARNAPKIDKLVKQVKRIEKWLKENDAKIGKKDDEIQSNITDNDSAQMHTSHGAIQGYNGQVVVDDKHQILLHGEAMGNSLEQSRHRWCYRSFS